MILEDILSEHEKEIYNRILKELEKNKEFYVTADPVEKTKALVKNCDISEKEVYTIMKKIAAFNGNSEKEGEKG